MSMRTLFYSIFFLFFFFFEPVYYAIMTITESHQRLMIPLTFFITLISLISYLRNRITRKEIICIFCLILFGTLYYSTTFLYGYVNSLFLTHFLTWLSLGNASVLMGMLITKRNYIPAFTQMIQLEPILNVLLTLIFIYRLMLGVDAVNGQFNDEYGLSYQSLGYYFAILFACNVFTIIRFLENKQKKIYIYILLLLLALQSVFCLMSGGRGGMVLLVVYIFFWSVYVTKNRILKKKYFLGVFLLLVILFILAATFFDITNSSGFERNSNAFSRDSRLELWKTYIPIFEESLGLGNGIGSNFYTWGFYSHNFIVDFLCETGIIGCVFFVAIYVLVYKRLRHYMEKDKQALFIMLFFIYAVVFNFFSLYWPSGQFNWMALGYVVAYNAGKIRKKNIDV